MLDTSAIALITQGPALQLRFTGSNISTPRQTSFSQKNSLKETDATGRGAVCHTSATQPDRELLISGWEAPPADVLEQHFPSSSVWGGAGADDVLRQVLCGWSWGLCVFVAPGPVTLSGSVGRVVSVGGGGGRV